jgi:hypothetical protein
VAPNGSQTRPLKVVHGVEQGFEGSFRRGDAPPSLEGQSCPPRSGS